jgi:serine/threonine protein kinase
MIYSKFRKVKFSKLKDYVYIKSFNKYSDNQFSNDVGLYRDKNNNKVVIRRFYYYFKNLKYYQIMNECNMIKLVNNFKMKQDSDFQLFFPKLIKFTNTNNEIIAVRDYFQGDQLRRQNRILKVKILTFILENFLFISKQISEEGKKLLPARTAFYIFTAFPIALVRTILKDPNNIFYYFRLSFLFYFQFFGSHNESQNVLAHRDLHSNNILIKEQKVQVLDLEIMLLAEEETDIAIISRCYSDDLNMETIIKLIKTNIKDKKRFIRLSIFYSIQLMANEPISSYYYKQTYNYLQEVFPKIISKLLLEKI